LSNIDNAFVGCLSKSVGPHDTGCRQPQKKPEGNTPPSP
jgi:hypothetical protein